MSDDAPPQTDGGNEGDEPVADPFAEPGEDADSFSDNGNSDALSSDDTSSDERLSDERLSDESLSDEPLSDDAVPTEPRSDDDPFDQLGEGVDAEAAADLDDAFEQMDVGGPAAEDVWESLDEDMPASGAAVDTESTRENPVSPGAAGPTERGVEHVVNKRTYCQQCPHFSAPPDVACGHEGTTIVETVSFDEFRVRDCPMVSEDDPTFDTDG